MKLSKETIKEFKEIYKKEFNQEIDDITAQKFARNLLLLFKVVYRTPINKNSNKYEQR